VRRWIAAVVLVAGLIAALAALYSYRDPEQLDLDDSVRRQTPGAFVRLTDGYTHYEIAGPPTGHLVVLAAGFSVPYYIWDPTFKALAENGFRVLRYDYYGRGFSDRPDVPYTQEFYVRQLAELLDSLQVTDSIDLTGLSLGGSIVTSFAHAYPDRVRSLIYVDPSFRSPGPAPARNSFVWDFLSVLLTEPGWADEQLGDFLHPEQFPDWPDRYRVQMQYRGFRRARLSELASNTSMDQKEELERVGLHSRRVLVIWGKQDPVVPFDDSVALLEAMPRARLVAIDDSGHLPQWERPVIFNAAIVGFLRDVGGGSPPP
jgi:pimeloyl-ACP methyl ester carboxylesterase